MATETLPRETHVVTLSMLEQRGATVRSVIDVGAAEGAFLLVLRRYNLFREANHLFIDAMEENARLYEMAKAKFGYPYAIAALSCVEGEVDLKIDPDFYNTHIAAVQVANRYEKTRRVPLRTLDNVVREARIAAPYLLKLDVQGGELDVLRGGIDTLAQTSIALVEIQTFCKRDGITELLPFMKGEGFNLFDLTDFGHFPVNRNFYQCYATFIRKEHDTRLGEHWCSPEQEAEALAALRARRAETIRRFERVCRPDEPPPPPPDPDPEFG